MKPTLKRLPWKAIRQAGYQARKEFFTVKVPDIDHMVVDANIIEVEKVLRSNNMRAGWVLSYNYYGEDRNLVRPEYYADQYEDYQLHIRLFKVDENKTRVLSHVELCPINHPKGHIKNVNMDIHDGIGRTESMMSSAGLEYKTTTV